MELVRETERDLGNFGAVEVKKPSKRKKKEFLLSEKNLTFYKEKTDEKTCDFDDCEFVYLFEKNSKKIFWVDLPTSSADSRIDIVGGVYVEEAFATLFYNHKACN